jgi:hypothetical protein
MVHIGVAMTISVINLPLPRVHIGVESLTRHLPLPHKRVFLTLRGSFSEGVGKKTLSEILVEVGGYKNNDDGSEVSQTADKR